MRQTVEIKSLIPNDWNPNSVDPQGFERLKLSIEREGIIRPPLVRETELGLQILGGEHRWRCAKELGWKEIEVENLGVVSDDKAKLISVFDNSRYGEDDTAQFVALLGDLAHIDDLQNMLAESEDDLEELLSMSSIDTDDLGFDDETPTETEVDRTPRQPKTHRIMRFKVPIPDGERITETIEATKKAQGFTQDDDLTNAGDALIHLLYGDG